MNADYEKTARKIQQYAAGIAARGEAATEQRRRFQYWSALTLLRGVFSSPHAGAAMLRNRMKKKSEETAAGTEEFLFEERIESIDDAEPSLELEGLERWQNLEALSLELESMCGLEKDRKLNKALEILREWIDGDSHPVVFCRFIATANYIGRELKPVLEKKYSGIDIQVITSEDPDEIRKIRIDSMKLSKRRVLIATDCLSEGINLQELFTSVLHYDLPWNPNRLEQREGRVDRFGQTSPVVKAYLLYGNNPVDGMVLKVLLEKVREIRKNTGITVPFPENSITLMDAVLKSVFNGRNWEASQLSLDFGDAERDMEQVTRQIEDAAKRETSSRTIFAQHSIKAEEIEEDLEYSDSAIGDPEAAERFVIKALKRYGVQVNQTKAERSFHVYPVNIPHQLKAYCPGNPGDGNTPVPVSFSSPVNAGFNYLGRTSPFVFALCRYISYQALSGGKDNIGRTSVVRSRDVKRRTVIVLLRMRNVIQERRGTSRLIAEEMSGWGYRGDPGENDFLSPEDAVDLLLNAGVSADVAAESAVKAIGRVKEDLIIARSQINRLAEEKAEAFARQHDRFRMAVSGSATRAGKFEVVRPVLPPDIVGIFILLPDIGGGAA